MKRSLRSCLMAGTVLVVLASGSGSAAALTLEEAVATAMASNPSIGQAIENRRAVEWELRQARGLYLPRVDLEARAGVRELDSPTRRLSGLAGDTLWPNEVGLVIRQSVFDASNKAEVEYQASRVDGASIRVDERAETLALDIALAYHQIRLNEAVITASEENIVFHEELLADIMAGTAGGTLTVADERQAQERLYAAQARLTETREELEGARIRFQRLVGEPVGTSSPMRSVAGSIPANVGVASTAAGAGNQTLRLAGADIDSAQALTNRARAEYLPEVFVEGRLRTGTDIDGVENRSSDYQAMVVLQWNLFNGGITSADVHEQVWRVGEQWNRYRDVGREVEQELRLAWTRRSEQTNLAAILGPQVESNEAVVVAYRDQFTIGRRSLLDLLNTQNTLYNSRVLFETARSAISFSEYRILAVTGELLNALGLARPGESNAYGRGTSGVPPTPDYDALDRRLPPAPEGAEDGFFGKL